MARSNKADAALDALGNPMRRRIVRLLAEKPRAVGELAAKLPVTRPAVSKHLAILRKADLVVRDKRGNRNVFRLHAAGFESARGWLDEFWDEALENLRALAEKR